MRDGTRIVWLRDPVTGQLLELFELSPRSPISEPLPRSPRNDRAVVFGVREVEPIVRRLETAGARVVARFDQGSARFVFLRDPNGIRIELVAWRSGSRRPEDPPLLSLVRRRRPRRRG